MKPTKMLPVAMALLLVSSNMAIAKVSGQKVTRKVVSATSASARNKNKAPTSQQLMNEIKKEITGSKLSRHKKHIAASVGSLPGGALAGFALVVGDPIVAIAGVAVAAVGSGVGYLASSMGDSIHALDETGSYPEIQQALNSQFLGHFVVCLVYPNHITDRTKKMLVQFLAHPYKDYGAKKINGKTYRFFFDPLNSQVWADIDVEHQVLFVRSSSISSTDIMKDPHYNDNYGHLIHGHYAGKPKKKKKEKY